MLELKNLYAAYGRKVRVLQGVNLRVDKQEIVCLIGNNGAGKSTLLKSVSGLLAPEEGQILFEGHRVDGQPAHRVAARGLVHVPEGRRIFPRLSILENLEMGAFSRGSDVDLSVDLDRVFGLFPVLGKRRQQWGGTLSGGEQQMLALGRALMSRPRLLMLDEPSMGLAPLVVEKIFETIQRIHQDGTPVLLVEQNAQQALRISHRGYVLETGKIVHEGLAEDLLQDPKVRDCYLGGA